MNKTRLAVILAACVFTLAAYADESEKIPPESQAKTNLEQPDFNTTTTNKEKKLPLASTPAGWTDSLKVAITRAKAENKYIMALFTGSDWCEYCSLLDKEVFSTPEFKEWAAKNVIKLYLDFPKYHSLPEKISAQNVAIFQRLGVEGFPTAVFFTSQGQPLTSLGYLPGGGANWIKQIEMLLPKTLKVNNSLASAINDSAAQNIPLLLGVFDSKSTTAALEKENIDRIFSAPELCLPSGKEIILAKIDYAKLDNKDKTLLNKLSKSDKFPKYILLNSGREPVFTSSAPVAKPAELAQKISTFITRPKYDGKWIQDYTQGLKLARLYNKPLLLFFTGSDWCVYCDEMQKKIFQTEEFAQKSKDYILVELDYPRTFELPDTIKMQNEVILNAYNIQGFPTVVVEKSNGMPIGGVGYNSQSVTEFFNTIEKSLNNS